MESPTLPPQLTLYTVAHPAGGWCAVAGCTEPFVTFCAGRAQELADTTGGTVVAHAYHAPALRPAGVRRLLALVGGRA